MKLTSFSLFAAICMAMISSSAVSATYYKWVDEKGVAHYTDKPPQEIKAKKISSAKRVPKTHRQVELEEQAAEAAVELEKVKKICSAAKQRLAALQNNSTIQMRSDDGSIRTLSQNEIKQQIDISKDNVKGACEGL